MSRSQATPIQGINSVFSLIPLAGGAEITLWNSDYEIDPSNAVAEGPNTTDGMIRAAGLNDYKGSVKGSTNTASTAVSIEANVMPGQIWQFKAYRDKTQTTFWTGYIIIGTDLKITTGVGTIENWEFSFMKAYGPLTLPNGSTF